MQQLNPGVQVVLFLPSSPDRVNFDNLRQQGNPPSGQVVDEIAFSSVPGSGQGARAATQESESGSVVSSAGESSSYYSANSFVGEAKAVTEAAVLEEKRVSVAGDAHMDSTAREGELGAEQMQKLVFGSLSVSTRVAAKPEFSSELATPLLDEPSAGGKTGDTQGSKAEPKKHKVLREEAAGTRRSSRRLSMLVSKFSPGSRTEVEELNTGESKLKSERARFHGESSEAEDTTTDCEKEGVVFAGRGDEVNEEIAGEEIREEVKYHRKKGDSARMTPKRKPTMVEEMVPKSSGKRRRNCLYGADCRGCSVPECGECAFCVDK